LLGGGSRLGVSLVLWCLLEGTGGFVPPEGPMMSDVVVVVVVAAVADEKQEGH
jgi:hypothetical protein